MDSMCHAATQLNEQDRELLVDVARAAKVAASSVDPWDRATRSRRRASSWRGVGSGRSSYQTVLYPSHRQTVLEAHNCA
jgi:hypothetical protein